MLEKFHALTEEKRNVIIEAAFAMFGKVGYKKASAKDIATAAGISKSMLFHYFGSKKNLYIYLIQYSEEIMMEIMEEVEEASSSDFFERVVSGTKIKLELLQRYPAWSAFVTSAYFEKDNEVTTEIAAFLQKGESYITNFTLADLDTYKFKESVDPELVWNILVKYSEGYVSNITNAADFDWDAMVEEFMACVALMKNNFYKEEYLDEHN